jgi:hypothetical protein
MEGSVFVNKMSREFLDTDRELTEGEAILLVRYVEEDGSASMAELGVLAHVLDDFPQTDGALEVISDYLRSFWNAGIE